MQVVIVSSYSSEEMKVLLVDHNDSFTQNLKHWLQPLVKSVNLINTEELNESDFSDYEKNYDLLVLSPGPHSPVDYPKTLSLLKKWPAEKLVLGVCLGAQCMAFLSEGKVLPYTPPKHGKTSEVHFQNKILTVARYHSLKIEAAAAFKVLASSVDDNVPMVFQHSEKNWLGFQFHPESFLTTEADFWLDYVRSQMNRSNPKNPTPVRVTT